MHFNVTAHPTDAWVAQQLREATPYGEVPRFLIRDRDRKYGAAFMLGFRQFVHFQANAMCGSVLLGLNTRIALVHKGQFHRVPGDLLHVLRQGSDLGKVHLSLLH